MSSGSEYVGDDRQQDDASSSQPSSPWSPRSPQTPRKRRRLDSTDPSQVREYDLERKYNDRYRAIFNEEVSYAAGAPRKEGPVHHYANQIGSSRWSSQEQDAFFIALERLGQDNISAICSAVRTKSEAEVRDLLLLLQEAASSHGPNKIMLYDIPAAVEIDELCDRKLEEAGDALAWCQERYEATIERERYGDYWLLTPEIADKIERAVDHSAQSLILPGKPLPEAERSGPGIAGACVQCKKRKVKCSRGQPCLGCIKANVDCVYPDIRSKSSDGITLNKLDANPVNIPAPDKHDIPEKNNDVLTVIPEAELLQAQTLLDLSRTIFMNRSPELPSPWLHWSEYTSQLASEPSMYLTAFKDFHTLVVSVTRRLVKAAIFQASSRLRAQRLRRSRKGLSPFIKKRDMLTAIRVLGMKENGRSYWKDVTRRCGVLVYETKKSSKGRLKRRIPWNEVEALMSQALPDSGRLASGAESLDESDDFQSRAMRSGTPLPMQYLSISRSDDGSEGETMSDETSNDVSGYTSDQLPQRRAQSQPRDLAGRYASVPPMPAESEIRHNQQDIQDFDREASQQEQQLLWELLGLEPSGKDEEKDFDGNAVPSDAEDNEKPLNGLGHWRMAIDYRSEWEEFPTMLTPAKILAKRKNCNRTTTESPLPNFEDTDAGSDFSMHDSSASEQTRQRGRKSSPVELRARSTTAYAALQSRDVGSEESDRMSGSYNMYSAVPSREMDVLEPNSDDGMDWQ